MDKKWIERYGNAVSGKKGRWLVLLAWIVLAAVLNVTLPQANSQKNEMAPNLEEETWSEQANKIAEKEFPASSGTPALLTWYRASGITDNDLSFIQQYTKDVTENPVSSQDTIVPFYQFPLPVLKEQLSKDGTTLILPLSFKKGADKEKIAEGIKQLKDKSASIFSPDPTKAKIKDANKLILRVTGPAGIAQDATELFSQGDLSLLLGTVAIVLVLLLVIYRSPILALIPYLE